MIMIDLIIIMVTIYLSYFRSEGKPSYLEWQISDGFPSYLYICFFVVSQLLALPVILPEEGITYFNLALIIFWQVIIYDCMIYIYWSCFKVNGV